MGVASLPLAGTVFVAFPEVNGAPVAAGPFPQPAVVVGTRSLAIPPGERVASATISGFWGTTDEGKSTAGVDVLVDGFLVAQCVKPDPNCYLGDGAARAWSHVFTASELAALDDGIVTVSAVQTSDLHVRLGVTTLVITTAKPVVVVPPPPVPTPVPALSPAGLLALLMGLAAAGMLALRGRGRS